MSKDVLRFDDRVVIITGAGGGLGRSHALTFGSRGAKVVVNDLGGAATGGGASRRAADAVVEEIVAAGGQAVASYDSVEDGERIVETAISAFGRVDVVINNAGILRDTSFQKMTAEDWDLIYRVHVLGAFRVTHAAWPHMRDQGFGRIVMTASAAGIYGNFGQANYAAAKLGLVGLSNTLALEGRRRGIHVNAIAPLAGSRLTETVLPEALVKALDPAYVSPLVAWLCHEDCDETGGLFEVGGGFFSKLRWERSGGKTVRLGRPMTVEMCRDRWDEISSFERSEHPPDITSSMRPVLANLEAGPSKGGNELVDVDLALGYEYPEQTTSYDERDLQIYALGVGAGADPLDDHQLRLVYELHGDGLFALPTFGVIPAQSVLMGMARDGHKAPGLEYGLDRLLHGEQYTEVTRPLPAKATLTHRARITDIFDKGKGALIVTETKSYDESGELLIVNRFTSFIRGAGGWGGDRGPSADVDQPPDRAPDAVVEQRIGEGQALLYRLCGDWNPLHADPRFARAFGFDRPILHGLCTFGYAGRHVIEAFCEGDPRYFKSIKVRFAASVFPGETLITEMFKVADRRILFRCKVKERDEVVISNAVVELYETIPRPKAKATTQPAAAPAEAAAPVAAAPTSEDVFLALGAYVEEHPELVKKVGTVFVFKLSAPDSAWTLDLKNGNGAVYEGEPAAPADTTLSLTDADFLAMGSGKLDPQKMFFSGQLKVSGNVMASQKLSFMQKIEPAWAREAVAKRKAARGAERKAAESQAPPATPTEATAPRVFEALGARLAKQPEVGREVGATLEVRVHEPDAVWTLALGEDPPAVREGSAEAPAATLFLSDADLAAMAGGKATAQRLYQRGKLRIEGDMRLARHLGLLNELF